MALDAYSLCPGGTGKKIKFCCGDLLPELQKIDRMIEGEQFLGCLKHIDLLMEQESNRDRECLLATKCMLLRYTEQEDEAKAAAAHFREKHPNNQIALAESALAVGMQDARKALTFVIRALRAANGALDGRVYEAMGLTAGALLHEDYPMSARALLQLQGNLLKKDRRPRELLAALSQASDVPLLLRDDAPILPCPENAPWKNRHTEAMRAVGLGDWETGADRLAALAADLPNEPIVWRNLATLRGWLADKTGCIEALRKYAAIRSAEPDGLDDAVEAEAASLFLSDDPLGDRLDVFDVAWTLKDADLAQEALLSSPRIRAIPFDPAQFSDGETPPPRAAFMLLDRPMPENAEGLTLDTVPHLLGHVLLFGRQTDREARLELMGLFGDELTAVETLIRETAADALAGDPTKEVVNHTSVSRKLLRPGWTPPRGSTNEQISVLTDQYQRDVLLHRWPEMKLGILDGRSPREASKDPNAHVRLLATLYVMAHWAEQLHGQVDLNDLRTELGLPKEQPVDLTKTPVIELPIVRLGRIRIEDLTDQDLKIAYYRSAAFAIRPLMRKFAEAMIHRPSLADSQERLDAFATLARTEESFEKAVEYINEGRRAAEAKKQSSAPWDLMELSLRFAMHDGQEAMRLIQHIQDKHVEEPGVAETLTRMLIDVGILRPDGTPAYMQQRAEPGMTPETPPAESGGLWTPDGGQSTGGGGKLWTPE